MKRVLAVVSIILMLLGALQIMDRGYGSPTSTMNGCGDGWERGDNIALDKPAKGYNLVDGYNNPSYADDGIKNDDTKVVSLGKTPSPEAWLEIDLQKSYYIYEIRILGKRLWSLPNREQSKIELQFFIKGHWVTIWSKNDMPNGIKQEITIPCSEYKTDKIRILKSKSTGLIEDILTIYEIEVYNAIDIFPPDTEIVYGPRNGTTVDHNNVKFKWRGIDNEPEEDLSYEWRIKNHGTYSGWTRTESREVSLRLEEGENTFEVRSIDSFGNVDPSAASVRFYVDLHSPVINIIAPDAGYLYVFGIKIMPVVVDDPHAVVIGPYKLRASARDTGSGLSHGEIYLNDRQIKYIDLYGKKDVNLEGDVYNGLFTYNIRVYDLTERHSSDSVKIEGYATGRDPPGYLESTNAPPYQVTRPIGPSIGKIDKIYFFSCKAEDVERDEIYYMFIWGDGTNSGWIGPYRSGESAEASHSWSKKGTYEVKVIVRDSRGNQGNWHTSTKITIRDSGDNNHVDHRNNVINEHGTVMKRHLKPIVIFQNRWSRSMINSRLIHYVVDLPKIYSSTHLNINRIVLKDR